MWSEPPNAGESVSDMLAHAGMNPPGPPSFSLHLKGPIRLTHEKKEAAAGNGDGTITPAITVSAALGGRTRRTKI